MINNKKILGIIPIRGGSKGVPRKNIREVAGKPLFVWSVIEAKKSKYLDRIIISTDDDEIIDVANKYGCDVPFKRPSALATDASKTIDAALNAIETLKEDYDYVVLLQATSPLRTVEDIDTCISMCVERDISSVVSVSLVDKSPYWMFYINTENELSPVIEKGDMPTRRQDSGNIYQLNGAVYVNEIEQLRKDKTFINKSTVAYIMPQDRSLDIDTETDILVLMYLLENKKSK